MPTQVPIEVFMIGKTEVDRDEVQRWMDFIGADEFKLPDEENVTNPALLVALAAKRCYRSFQTSTNPNLTRVRQDYAEYLDNILASAHGAVLEHSVYNFAIENVSRVWTSEMNRHRAGWAISEGSLRFIRFGENIPYWEPDSIQATEQELAGRDADEDAAAADAEVMHYLTAFADYEMCGAGGDPLDSLDDDLNLFEKKCLSRAVFRSAFGSQEQHYRILERIWRKELSPESKFKSKKEITSMMRRIVGLGVATGGVWTGNIRALRHVFTLRCSPAAEEEMVHVFSRIVRTMVAKEPMLFGDFEQDTDGFWRPRFVKV